MSHTLSRSSMVSDPRVWLFLTQVDAVEAETCRAAGCPRCGGVLHSARYPRKPYGLAVALRGDVWRFSFCCAACRGRETPPSVRFFGRRSYELPRCQARIRSVALFPIALSSPDVTAVLDQEQCCPRKAEVFFQVAFRRLP